MDILSKKLDIAFLGEKIGSHPGCVEPLVTHLSFADDLLIFFDGFTDSLREILSVLRGFQRSSRLALNFRKTCFLLMVTTGPLQLLLLQNSEFRRVLSLWDTWDFLCFLVNLNTETINPWWTRSERESPPGQRGIYHLWDTFNWFNLFYTASLPFGPRFIPYQRAAMISWRGS